jgi:hypothetical protein
MRSGVTQSLDTIHPEAREMVRMAARRAGFSVREWLNSVIIEAAKEAGVPTVPRLFEEFDEPLPSHKHNLAALHSRLDDLAAQIEWLAQGYPHLSGGMARGGMRRATSAFDSSVGDRG